MTTQQYLGQIERFDMTIQNRLADIHNLRCMIDGTRGTNDEERVQTSMSGDSFSRMVDRILDMEKEVDKIIDKRLDIIKQIEDMENVTYCFVLFDRYVMKMKFDQIAEDVSYSYRQTLRVHEEALEAFEKTYGNQYLSKSCHPMSPNVT